MKYDSGYFKMPCIARQEPIIPIWFRPYQIGPGKHVTCPHSVGQTASDFGDYSPLRIGILPFPLGNSKKLREFEAFARVKVPVSSACRFDLSSP